jgi:drug/metabolite transporter (DMT)-like permease
MHEAAKSNLRGALFSLGAFGLFATHDVLIKYLGGHYATFQIVFFSVLLSFPLVMLMLMRDTTRATLIPVHPWWTALRTLAAIITGTTAFYAFSVLPLTQTYAILFATPLLITVLSIPILGETVRWHRWAAVIVGLIGVLVVLRPGSEPLGLGHIAAMVAAVCGALASVIVRKIGRDERSAVLLLYPLMANFVIMGAILPFVYVPLPIEDFGALAVVSVLAFSGGLMVIAAYKAGDAAVVAPMQYSQIVWATVYGFIFFDETPDTPTIVGAGIVILSGLYIVLRESMTGISRTRPMTSTRLRPETGTSPRSTFESSLPAPGE